MIQIAIVNHSTVVSDAELAAALPDFSAQINEDFGPVYAITASLRIMPKDGQLNAGEWQMVVADTSDQANALGYHERTITGMPIGYCFAKSTIDDGGRWSTCFSHEMLEMLADPEINGLSLDGASGRAYASEVCDACEDEQFAYQKAGGTWVSDFVRREFWMGDVAPTAPLSFTGAIKTPLQILTGGYLSYTIDLQGWQQSFGDGKKIARGSRFARRSKHRVEHRLSTRH
jgi:hypothetical protein